MVFVGGGRTIGEAGESAGQVRGVDDGENIAGRWRIAARQAERLACDREVTDYIKLAVVCPERRAIDRRSDDWKR